VADQALTLALREGGPTGIGMAHAFQTIVRHNRGDLIGAEQQYTEGLKFFDDPVYRRGPGAALWTFGIASRNAWMLGHADVARDRMTQMMAAAKQDNPHDLAISWICAAALRCYLKEYEQVEALAARALELSEKNQFPPEAAYSRIVLGKARAQLGRTTEGVALIRQGMASEIEIGARVSIPSDTVSLATAQMLDGAIVEAFETVERSLEANPEAHVHRPWALELRGELRLKQGDTDLAEADFRESIALAQNMGVKACELSAATSLARLLAKQGRRDEARTMLADIYGWFTEGFDTADLKDAKALLDELNG